MHRPFFIYPDGANLWFAHTVVKKRLFIIP